MYSTFLVAAGVNVGQHQSCTAESLIPYWVVRVRAVEILRSHHTPVAQTLIVKKSEDPAENAAVIMHFSNVNTPSLAIFRREVVNLLFIHVTTGLSTQAAWFLQRCKLTFCESHLPDPLQYNNLVSTYVLAFIMAYEMTFRLELSNVSSCVWIRLVEARSRTLGQSLVSGLHDISV